MRIFYYICCQFLIFVLCLKQEFDFRALLASIINLKVFFEGNFVRAAEGRCVTRYQRQTTTEVQQYRHFIFILNHHIFFLYLLKKQINSNVVVTVISPTFSGLEECYLGIAQIQKPRHKNNPQVPTSNLSVLAYHISCVALVRNLGVHTVHSSD